jgi:hypothetical protein
MYDAPPPDPDAPTAKDKKEETSTPKGREASGKVTPPPSSKTPPPEFKDPTAFDAKWKTLKSGETIIGPDGKPHTKK